MTVVCKGVIAYEIATGDIHIFEARAVTFATGGFGKIYKVSSNAHSLTGDGPGNFISKRYTFGRYGVLSISPNWNI